MLTVELIKILGAISIAGLSIGLAFVAVRQLARMEAKRRSKVEVRYKTMIDYSDFSDKQKYWLINSAATKMVAYQLVGRASSIRFYALNEAAIVILGLNIAIPASIAAFWPGQAMHGLAVIAITSAIGVVLTAWDKLEQNSSRWQDYHEIAALIEDALDELLADTPEIPLDKQFNQFVLEYREIGRLERELQRKRVDKAQAAASEQAESIKSSIQKSREEYRSEYENGSSDNAGTSSSPDPLFMGIADLSDNVGRSGASEGRRNEIASPEVIREQAWAAVQEVRDRVSVEEPVVEQAIDNPMQAIDESEWPQWQAKQLANASDDEDAVVVTQSGH